MAEAMAMKDIPPHPNVVLFRGVTMSPDPLCIVLEYCKFGSLLHYLRSDEKITSEQKVKLAKHIARGMAHLHNGKKGVELIHRDLAARNILLKDGFVAAVSDFGMARMKDDSDDASHTQQNIGPIKWMSPESLEKKHYSKKSDIFSYGVVLYEIVAREEPWKGVAPGAVAYKVISGERLSIPSSSPPVLTQIMESCWSHNPQDRPEFLEIVNILIESKNSSFLPQ